MAVILPSTFISKEGARQEICGTWDYLGNKKNPERFFIVWKSLKFQNFFIFQGLMNALNLSTLGSLKICKAK